MKRTLWVSIVAVVAIGLFVWWFLANFERIERAERVGGSAAARRNPLLATERFLAAMGLATTTRETLVRLPAKDHVLILVAPRRFLGKRRSSWLLDWVRDGGRLILRPQQRQEQDDEPDHLLQALGISVRHDDELGVVWSHGDPSPPEPRPDAEPAGRFAVDLPGLDRRLEMARYTSAALVDEAGTAHVAVYDQKLARILHRRFGRGSVTVLAEHAFLTNTRVGKYDHAAVAWELVHLEGRPAGIWIVLSDDMPGIASLLLHKAWPALLAGGVLLVVWLWFVGGRFGPALPEPEPTRRSLREHLDAAGRFLWRRRAGSALLAAIRRRLQERLSRRHPDLAAVPLADAVPRLAEISAISPARLRTALLAKDIPDPRRFTQAVRDLQTLATRL